MNINDLSILLAAIDLAVKRGAFSILEVGAVGDVATKLNDFLKSANEQAQAAQAAQQAGEQPAVEQQPTEQPAQTSEGTPAA